MALDKNGLKGRIEAELEAQGFTITGQHAWASKLAQAVANAVVDEIQANAKAVGNDSRGDTHNLDIT
jgi:hypothetical protein